jgi:RimJ/RimL family protein N-acetyltransferase
MNQTLNCSGFILRTLHFSDKQSLARHANNINIWRNLRDVFPHPYSPADADQFIASARESDAVHLAIVLEEEACGVISLIPQEGIMRYSMELGYWLGESYWNRGIMTAAIKRVVAYAFDELPVNRIFACVFSTNPTSMHLLKKCGFDLEGIGKKAFFKDGGFVDEYRYSRINEQF